MGPRGPPPIPVKTSATSSASHRSPSDKFLDPLLTLFPKSKVNSRNVAIFASNSPVKVVKVIRFKLMTMYINLKYVSSGYKIPDKLTLSVNQCIMTE